MQVIATLLALSLAPAPTYADTLTQLADADASAAQDPKQAVVALPDVLVQLTRFPAAVASDPAARALQILALLSLARSYLLLDKAELAGATIDEAIRTAQGRALPVADFGPSLESIYQARVAALEQRGRARLRVSCAIPCHVFVNERQVPTRSEPMVVGVYRVWVVDPLGLHPPLLTPVRLDPAGAVVELVYQPRRSEPVRSEAPPEPVVRPRLQQRKVEIAMMALGVGLAGVGTWMVAARELRVEGPAVIGLGGVSFLIGGVLLVVDEGRAETTDSSQTAISWPLRF